MTMPRVLRVGTRGSALARRQTDLVLAELRRDTPDIQFEVHVIRTLGDDAPEVDLSQFEGQGVFVRAIETALLSGQIDLAVHSFKDMPSQPPAELAIGAFPVRADPRDALVTRGPVRLDALPPGAAIGTGSPRRRVLLQSTRPDLVIEPIRGNVDTRLRAIANGDLDGVVLAVAGLARLQRASEIGEILDPTIFTPAIGQGILAVQARADDRPVLELMHGIDDPSTRACATAERAYALAVGAGCQVPVGAYAHVAGGTVTIDAFLAVENDRILRARASSPVEEAAQVGTQAGQMITAQQQAADPQTAGAPPRTSAQ